MLYNHSITSMLSKVFKLLFLSVTLIILYGLCRVVFVYFNYEVLHLSTVSDHLLLFFYGLRFDISGILLSNALFTILYLLPIEKYLSKIYWHQILKWIFLTVNSFFIFINFVDAIYYPFVKKRAQSDMFLFANGEKGQEVFGLIPTFALEYWYVWVLFLVSAFLLWKSYDQILKQSQGTHFVKHTY
ncbi:MAG: hypothetical protein WAU01_16480, partial [Saprospiraceae bacterium]